MLAIDMWAAVVARAGLAAARGVGSTRYGDTILSRVRDERHCGQGHSPTDEHSLVPRVALSCCVR